MTDAAALASSVVNSPAAIALASSDGPGDVSSRFNRRQIEYDRPALAQWHKPLDTKPHGSRIAALRRRDHSPNDVVPIIFEERGLWRDQEP
jgi:hypothetical protein